MYTSQSFRNTSNYMYQLALMEGIEHSVEIDTTEYTSYDSVEGVSSDASMRDSEVEWAVASHAAQLDGPGTLSPARLRALYYKELEESDPERAGEYFREQTKSGWTRELSDEEKEFFLSRIEVVEVVGDF